MGMEISYDSEGFITASCTPDPNYIYYRCVDRITKGVFYLREPVKEKPVQIFSVTKGWSKKEYDLSKLTNKDDLYILMVTGEVKEIGDSDGNIKRRSVNGLEY